MTVRSPRYLITLAGLAVGMILFLFAGVDPLMDWIGLSKGMEFLWAGISLILTAIVLIGLVIDLVVFTFAKNNLKNVANG